MGNPAETVFSSEDIQRRVAELASEISRYYEGRRLLCLVVLRGGFFFAADLVRGLQNVKVELEFVKLQSYAGTRSSGEVEFRGQLPVVSGRDVLVIEDLIDTGLTLTALHQALKAQGPRSLKYAVAVKKEIESEAEFECEYVAFRVEHSDFLVGYGMDFEGRYRTLPEIRRLSVR